MNLGHWLCSDVHTICMSSKDVVCESLGIIQTPFTMITTFSSKVFPKKNIIPMDIFAGAFVQYNIRRVKYYMPNRRTYNKPQFITVKFQSLIHICIPMHQTWFDVILTKYARHNMDAGIILFIMIVLVKIDVPNADFVVFFHWWNSSTCDQGMGSVLFH